MPQPGYATATQLAVSLELVGNSASGTAQFSAPHNKNPVHHLEILHTTSFPELGQDLGTSLSHGCHGLVVSEAASHTAVNHHQTKHSQKGPLCELYRDFRTFATLLKICKVNLHSLYGSQNSTAETVVM